MNWNSIIRRGNHFIRVPPDWIWVLIDGPWFKYLNRFGPWLVRIPYTAPLDPLAFTDVDLNAPPSYLEVEYLEWEKIRIHPGAMLNPKEPYRRRIYYGWQNQRSFFGWKPDCDKIPCYLGYPEWIDDPYWSNRLMERGQ